MVSVVQVSGARQPSFIRHILSGALFRDKSILP
jgi:hypothetical protein